MVIFDRAARGTMYDWPASAASSDGEITYLIVDALGGGEAGRYRVSCVDGERRTYDDAQRLIADLDHIEARRGASRLPATKQPRRVVTGAKEECRRLSQHDADQEDHRASELHSMPSGSAPRGRKTLAN